MSRNGKDKEQKQCNNFNSSNMPYDETARKFCWSELEITGRVRSLSPRLWELDHLTSLYLKENNLSVIPADIARLKHLLYLDLCNNFIREIPPQIGQLVRLKELLLSNNRLSILPYELGKLFNLQTLKLSGNPWAPEFQSLVDSCNVQKVLGYLLNRVEFKAQCPAEREWICLENANNSRSCCIFTVMCYNVLCDKYATRQMYGYCPPWALEWSYRKQGIMDEIRRFRADIITLQEVETDQFYNFFEVKLRAEGYEGIFSPKSRAKTMNENERKYVDGCAIFWKTTKFSLVKEHLIEFNQLAMANHDGSEDMLNRVMTKDNIGLAALLQTTENAWTSLPDKNQIRQPILVCTAHIHWDPEFCDVKLIQTIMLMSEIRSIVNSIVEDCSRGRHLPRKDIHDIHLLLCGDLNSLPESGVVEFMTKGCVSMDHEDFKGHGYKTSLQKIALSSSHNSSLVNTTANMYSHGFRLASTYDTSIMPFTNYTYDFKGIIDYIFHSCSTMKTLGVLGPINPQWFADHQIVGCPHPHIPSDHFPLLAELELTPSHSSLANGLLSR